jgi:hypothetical protein
MPEIQPLPDTQSRSTRRRPGKREDVLPTISINSLGTDIKSQLNVSVSQTNGAASGAFNCLAINAAAAAKLSNASSAPTQIFNTIAPGVTR